MKSAAYSPDGARIVTASGDRTARVWDAATAREIIALRGHEEAVNSAVFSARRRPHCNRLMGQDGADLGLGDRERDRSPSRSCAGDEFRRLLGRR